MNKFDEDIEMGVLGSCMSNESSYTKVVNKCIEEDFFTTRSKGLFKAIKESHEADKTLDILLIAKLALEKYKIPITYTTQVSENLLSSSQTNAYINKLLEYRIEREYTKLANDMNVGKVKDAESVKARLKDIEFITSKIGNDNTIITLDQVKITDVYKAEKIPTGFKDIDKKILGFCMGSLNIITGYNGNGKSTLINQMCIAESLSRGYKVFAYSPELTNSNLKSWLYPTLADEDHFLNKLSFSGEQYKAVGDIGINLIDEWIKDKLFIYSDDSITHEENRLLRDMHTLAEKGVKVFVIDNLMKIELKGSYKNELIAQREFVNRLKEFARKYNAVLHLVAHPRKPQQGNTKITKYDIAGSGDITNLADYVVSITRITDEQREKFTELSDKDAIIKVMKDRVKGTGEFYITLNYDVVRKRFYNYQEELNKSYGYCSDLVQVENSNIFDFNKKDN